jgi:type I restriction enzyme S subunit
MMFWPLKQINLTPLKYVAKLNPETLHENTPPDFKFNYIDIGSVIYGQGVTEKQEVMFANAPSRARKPVLENDVIISTVRTYLRAIARIGPDDVGSVVSTGFAVCRTYPKFNSNYLFYAVHSQPFIDSIAALSTGISYPAINPSTLGDIKLPVPAVEIQDAIARFLDRETSRIDSLIEKKGRFIELLKEKRAAVITHAVTKGIDRSVPLKDSGEAWLGHIAANWIVLAASRLFRERDERSSTGEEELLSVSHLTGVTRRSEKTVHMIMAESTVGYKKCLSGDLVINTLWAWMGAMGTAPMLGIVSPAYNVYTPRSEVFHPRFVDHIVRLPIFAKEVTRFSKGVWSSRLRLYPESFREVRFAVPPVAEQVAIADYLDLQIERIDNLTAKTQQSIDLLKEKRSALITAAVIGKIDVRDAA